LKAVERQNAAPLTLRVSSVNIRRQGERLDCRAGASASDTSRFTRNESGQSLASSQSLDGSLAEVGVHFGGHDQLRCCAVPAWVVPAAGLAQHGLQATALALRFSAAPEAHRWARAQSKSQVANAILFSL
jgi:hypothetical protein